MKILIAGDVHGSMTHMIHLLDTAKARGIESLFCLGDFGAWEHFDWGRKFFSDVNRHARTRGLMVYFLDGNHDKTSLLISKYGNKRDPEGFLTCRPRVKYAPRGHVWTWGGASFMSLGGAYSVDKDSRLWRQSVRQRDTGVDQAGTEWFPEEEMTDDELEVYLTAAPPRIDVLLTHDKPRSSNPRINRKDIMECWPNQDRIDRAVQRLRPKMLFHGHLHLRYADLIRHNSGFTEVYGLGCDPRNSLTKRAEDSWHVLDIGEEEALYRPDTEETPEGWKLFCDRCGGEDPRPVDMWDGSGEWLHGVPCFEHRPYLHSPH